MNTLKDAVHRLIDVDDHLRRHRFGYLTLIFVFVSFIPFLIGLCFLLDRNYHPLLSIAEDDLVTTFVDALTSSARKHPSHHEESGNSAGVKSNKIAVEP